MKNLARVLVSCALLVAGCGSGSPTVDLSFTDMSTTAAAPDMTARPDLTVVASPADLAVAASPADLTTTALDGCNGILMCSAQCPQNAQLQACVEACLQGGTTKGQQLFASFLQCGSGALMAGGACPTMAADGGTAPCASETSQACAQCLNNTCGPSQAACIADKP